MKKVYSQMSPESLRKALLLYLAAILFIFSLFLILTIANPIYGRLKKSENNNVYHDIELTAMTVNEWSRRVMDIATQITSRTRIRQELEKYNNKEISLTQLTAFTEPKLSDAMNMSEDIIGITLLDNLGKAVAQCGQSIPLPIRPIDYSGPVETSVSTPVIQNGRHLVVVSAPIINRSKQYIGTDLVLMDLYQLKNNMISSSKTDSEKNYETILGYTSDGAVFETFTEIKNINRDMVNNLLKKAFRGQKGIDDESPVFVAAYHGLDIKNFGLVILKNKTELYRTLNTRLIYWGLTGIFAYIGFLAGFWFLMKPLANRLLLHSDELNEKVKEQTRHLEEEIKERKRTAAELEQIITEHRQTEIALSESEQKYRLLANNVTDVIWSVDMNLRYNYISPSIEKIHGYTPEEIMEIPLKQSFTPDSYQKIIEIFSRERNRDAVPEATRSAVLELNLRHKCGKIIPVEVNASFLRDESGFPIGIIGITRDISERKQAEQALRDSESKFRSIFNNKGTATCLFGDDRIIRECNPTFEELSGFSKSDIVNKMAWSDFFTKEDVERMQQYHDQRSQGTGSPPSQYESGFISKDGGIKTVIINISLVGKERILSLTDITKRKLAETENENLHKKLAQSQKMEAMGSLAGGIAHDFNNILGAIIGFTELAKMDKADGEKNAEYLDRVLIAADRAKDLVHQILTFSRRTEQEIKPLKVEPIIKEVLQFIRASLPSTIEIQSEIHSDSLIMGDQTQIHQVVLNLCSNAGYAMREDGGTLYVGLTNERLGPDFTANIPDLSIGDYVKIDVKDTGHGISSELIERIFEPFFTTKDQGEGTGMGLAVVHGIVKRMKGEIVVESSLGKGSSFSVYLPVVQNMEKTDEPKEDALASKGCGHILFVDDEPALVDIGELLLKELGYHVTTKTSGIEALEAFKSNPDEFDLVLTDMTMPHMTGERLAKEILSIRKEIPIIISTGFSSVMTEKKALKLGAKGLLMKPFVLSELARGIQNVLDSKTNSI